LHGLLDGHVRTDRYQEVQVIGHDHEVMEPEFPGRYVRTQHVDHQRGVAFRLQQGKSLAGLRSGEERTCRTRYLIRAGISRRFGH
jgi:hypothetical protein